MADRRLVKKWVWGIVVVLAIVVSAMGVVIIKYLYSTNIVGITATEKYIFIPTNSDFEKVVQILKAENLLIDEKSFRWTAHRLKYDIKIKPGKYLLKPKMSNLELVTLLRSGRQVPVQVTFNNMRTKEQLAKRISEQLESSQESILDLMNDSNYTKKLGFTSQSILSMFLPNTYEFYWNTNADKMMQRMKREYDKFWNSERMMQVRKINLTPLQVSILASIVQMETNKDDEKPIIAGVYLNRYHKDWKLEADPTLVFALGNFSVNRILNIYKDIDSPYNTYKYHGLPPGPICLPTSISIDAVLNYNTHNYMYFCAKDDFSGYHAFASTYSQHLVNAQRFRRALDRRGIRS